MLSILVKLCVSNRMLKRWKIIYILKLKLVETRKIVIDLSLFIDWLAKDFTCFFFFLYISNRLFERWKIIYFLKLKLVETRKNVFWFITFYSLANDFTRVFFFSCISHRLLKRSKIVFFYFETYKLSRKLEKKYCIDLLLFID